MFRVEWIQTAIDDLAEVWTSASFPKTLSATAKSAKKKNRVVWVLHVLEYRRRGESS